MAFVGIGQGGGNTEPRWCKRCLKVFSADKCDAGHPVFSYTKQIPPGGGGGGGGGAAKAAREREIEVAGGGGGGGGGDDGPDHDRLYRGRHGGLDIAAWASEDSASAAKLPGGGGDDTLFGEHGAI